MNVINILPLGLGGNNTQVSAKGRNSGSDCVRTGIGAPISHADKRGDVAIVNQELAAKLYPKENAIGQTGDSWRHGASHSRHRYQFEKGNDPGRSVGDDLQVHPRSGSFWPQLRRILTRHDPQLVVEDVVSAEEIAAKKMAADAEFGKVEAMVQPIVKDYAAGKSLDVKVLPTGVKVLVKDPGNGAEIKKGEQVAVHYYGCLPDGKMFDNSFQRHEPLPFAAGMGQMIPGFDQATMTLRHGSKAVIFLPYDQAYGEAGMPAAGIPEKSELIFYIEIQ